MKSPSLNLILLVLLSFQTAFAQTKNDLIGLSFGPGNFHITDEHSSHLIFRGTGIAPSINWQHIYVRNSHYAEGCFFYANLSSSADNFSTENFRGRFRYTFFHTTADSLTVKRRFVFYYGGSVTSFYCKSDYYFDMRTIRARSIASWYLSHSLDLAFQLHYYLSGRDYFGFQINSTLISNVARPPFSSSGDYDYDENDWIIKPFGRTVFFPQNPSVNTNMFYQVPVSPRLNIRFNWEFYYMKYFEPDDIGIYMNNFKLGIYYLI